VGLDDEVGRHAGGALEAVDVLGEEHAQQALAGQQGDEDVGDGRAVARARVELARERVERRRVLPEEAQVEDRLGLGQVQRRLVGVEACVRGAEVGDWRGRARGLVSEVVLTFVRRISNKGGLSGGNALPAAVEMPAPVMTTMRRARPDLM
jgi:hypothetical protein